MYLEKARKPKIKPPIITIVGAPGQGKSTIGALFPAPIFIQAEQAESTFESWDEEAQPFLLPPIPRSQKSKGISPSRVILEQINELKTAEHSFKTLVIDTVSSLDHLLKSEVTEKHDAASIAEAAGGFSKGFLELAELHAEIRQEVGRLSALKNMAVVFLCHVDIKKRKNSPDEPEFTHYTLQVEDKCAPFYINFSDAVLFLRSNTFVQGHQSDKRGNTTKFGKIIDTGDRVLVTCSSARPGYPDAKNRYDLEPEIAVDKGENPLLKLIPFFNQEEK